MPGQDRLTPERHYKMRFAHTRWPPK
jgi:hypothetical protein